MYSMKKRQPIKTNTVQLKLSTGELITESMFKSFTKQLKKDLGKYSFAAEF